MKYMIVPPEGYYTPNYKLYYTVAEALRDLEGLDESMDNTEEYTILAVALTYKPKIIVKSNGPLGGGDFSVVDQDGDEICGETFDSVGGAISHLVKGHGDSYTIREVEQLEVMNSDGDAIGLTATLELRMPPATMKSPDIGVPPRIDVSSLQGISKSEPNEILLGKENDNELE